MAWLAELNEPTNRSADLARRIGELETAVLSTRLEAMRLAALILTKINGVLPAARVEVANTEELALLQGRHAGLMTKAEDLQTQIDRLRADEYDQAYRL